MTTNCVYHMCPILKKTIPCKIVPNFCEYHDTNMGRRFFICCSYDFDEFDNHNITKEEVYRYSDEIIQINNVYPANTQEEIDYYNLVVPDKIIDTENHEIKELDRFEKIINMICDLEEDLSVEVFFNLAQFISYELLFTYCNQTERIFFQTISSIELTQQPVIIEAPQIITMTKTIFNKIDTNLPYFNSLINGASSDRLFKLHNIRRFTELNYINFPILINIDVLKTNVNYIILV